MKHVIAALGLIAVVIPALVAAQGPPPAAPAKPDSPEVLSHIAAARKAAGEQWQSEAEFFCGTPRANRPDDPLLEPTRIFDNVSVIGRAGTAVFAITTSGGIVLIDSGYYDQLQTVLLPGLKALGLDESNVKYILHGHGHGDHMGGSAYFQEKHGTRQAMGAPDWDVLENPPAPRGGGANAPGAPAPPAMPNPKRDMVLTDGQVLTIGDTKITVVAIPGHTPGSLGFIFPVKDGRETHMAALYGGTILLPERISTPNLQVYVNSLDHFAQVARMMNVDVELQNHPLYDHIADKVAGVRAGKRGASNPFIVGKEGYQRFLTVKSECIRAQLARRSPA
jgi:metallo-beta-lactamase class B